MLDRRVVEILTNLYREIGHRHWRLGPLRFPCYSVRPNILGEWPNVYATQKSTAGGCAFFRYNDSNSGETLSERESSAHLGFDASRVSSLYQNSLYDVRVNALFGLLLIRAY